MKWLGWVVAVIMVVVLFIVRDSGNRRLGQEKAKADGIIAAKQAEVDLIFEKASTEIPPAEARLKQETAKKQKLESDRDRLVASRNDLEQQVELFQRKTDQLKDEKQMTATERQESVEEIRGIQPKIARVEKQLQILKQAISSVTEGVELR